MAPELVERVIQKLFARDPTFMAMARGKNLPKEVVDIIQAAASYFWTNPDQIQSSGTLRQKTKTLAREFCVTGQTAVETFYDAAADVPDFRVWPVEDVVFNPSMNLKTSNRYYFRQFVSMEYLESMEEETGDDGKPVKGLFKADAVANVRTRYANMSGSMKSDPTPNQVMRSGSNALTPHVEDILMVTRWDPKTLKVCRIVDWTDVIQEAVDPLGIGEFPFDFAMDIEVPKQPYAFGLLDFISGVTQAKDLFLNQVVDYGSRALNPPLFVNPASPAVNKQTLRNAFKVGGIVFANPQDAQHAQYPPLPTVGFQLLDYLQGRAEGVSGISPYLGGIPNAATDKTKGTKGGTLALIDQAGSPIQDRQQNLEESIIQPVVNKFLKIAGSLMAKNEEKYVWLTGHSPKWIQLTKGMLEGNITLPDLVAGEIVANDPKPDPVTGQPPADPRTGKPVTSARTGYLLGSDADMLAMLLIQEGKNPKSHVLFDVDWVVQVETGSMAEQDAAADVQNFQDYVSFRVQYRIPTDFQKISVELANRMGIKNADQYDLDPSQPGNSAPFDLPKISVHFNDLPVAGKIQVAKNMGVTLTDQDFSSMGTLPDTTPQGLNPFEIAGNNALKGSGQPQQQSPQSPPAPLSQPPPMPGR